MSESETIQLNHPISAGSIMCSPENTSGISYTRHLLDIEMSFDHCWAFTWLTTNWTLIYYFIGIYLAAIFTGRKYMKSRPPFQLRGALLVWNVVLATYSMVATWRMLSALVYNIQIYGFHVSICYVGPAGQRHATALWLMSYVFSKVVEFGDTAFIVLRKSPLIFLHWYHHVTVAFFVWSTGAYASPMQTYFSTVNLFVHSIMYSYYALKVLGIHVPKQISMAITSLQIFQMVIGILITSYMYWAKTTDRACQVAGQGIAIAATIYFSYFLLFMQFFKKAYVMRRASMLSSNVNVKKVD